MEHVVMIAALCVIMLIIGYFIGQSDVIKLKKDNLKINQLYRKTALEMQILQVENHRLKWEAANKLPKKKVFHRQKKQTRVKLI